MVERLQERVHVARGSLVLETNESSLLLGVVRGKEALPVASDLATSKLLVGQHLHLSRDDDRVVEAVALRLVVEVSELDELLEAPVGFAREEDVRLI